MREFVNLKMGKCIIFDFGGVLVDWNPHYLYDKYFGSRKKADWFLGNICTPAWNVQMDAGKPFAEGIDEKIAEHPEWEKEIRMYWDDWEQMMGEQITGMQTLLEELRAQGYALYGLSNWSAETFNRVRNRYPIFGLLDGMVISGEEHVAKPDARIYEILLQRYHIAPKEAIFVDDNKPNTDAAETLGIRGIVFQSAEQTRTAIAQTAGGNRYAQEDLREAVRVLRAGGVILYPTDTVWGIGCDATNEAAVQRIFDIKHRADSKSMLVLLDGAGKLQGYVERVPDTAWTLLEASEGGKPLTIIYPRAKNLAKNLTAEDGSIGIRITQEAFSRALCEQLHRPIVSTSANISGEKAASTFREIAPEIREAVDYVCQFRREDETKHKPSSIIKIDEAERITVIRE